MFWDVYNHHHGVQAVQQSITYVDATKSTKFNNDYITGIRVIRTQKTYKTALLTIDLNIFSKKLTSWYNAAKDTQNRNNELNVRI